MFDFLTALSFYDRAFFKYKMFHLFHFFIYQELNSGKNKVRLLEAVCFQQLFEAGDWW